MATSPRVGRGDHFCIADGTARLNGSGRPSLCSRHKSVGEGEERVAQTTLPAKRSPASCAFQTAMRLESTRLIWPAPIQGSGRIPRRQLRST